MNAQTIALPQPRGVADDPHASRHGEPHGVARFLGHFGEMFAAMLVGMPLFGMPLAVLVSALLGPEVVRIPEVRALGMAVAMTLAMVAWMRFRGHSSRATAEMAAAMIVPTVALFPVLWAGLISDRMLLGLEHGLMIPAMVIAMVYRRREYGL